jgi:YidC/Oxa1 family membrane protein insertase
MDRNTIIRWVVIAAAIILFWKCGLPLITGKSGESPQAELSEKYVNHPDFVPDQVDDGKSSPPEGQLCTINGNKFVAEMSSRGAAIKHFKLLEEKYAKSAAADMSTTPDHERWRNLRTLFGEAGKHDQLKYDRFPWKLKAENNSCAFTYEDEQVKIVKLVRAGDRPYELNVETAITNLAEQSKKHRFSIGAYAYRTNKEVSGSLGRVSPFVTELSCANTEKVTRKAADDFKTGWVTVPGIDRWAAVSNYYFAQVLLPTDNPEMGQERPSCSLLAEAWYSAGQKPDDDNAAKVYHSYLTYRDRELKKGEQAVYKQIAFFGPKERDVLKGVAGGTRGTMDLVNLGFFTPVAKVLVAILDWLHDHITMGNWGIAIILMTIGVRMLLFPLTWKSIKTTIAMRKLKPEVDALNEKFKDDAQAKNLAMMELWRKHKVNPFGGCLPQLVQMPVWFAMYTTLQTAAEMYQTKFLWFQDMSAPDKYYVMPFLLGGFMILQQRIVPQQGMDPMQQKMMTWLLPIIFTVMMLFLPAALGVYMLTNSILGIVQQLAVEKFAPSKKQGEIVVTEKGKDTPQAFGKGKARV